MQRLSYQTETVLSNKIPRNRLVLSFKDIPRKPLGRRPIASIGTTRKLAIHAGWPYIRGCFKRDVLYLCKLNY